MIPTQPAVFSLFADYQYFPVEMKEYIFFNPSAIYVIKYSNKNNVFIAVIRIPIFKRGVRFLLLLWKF